MVMKARFREVGPMSDSIWILGCLVFKTVYLLRVSSHSGKQYLGAFGLFSVLLLSFADCAARGISAAQPGIEPTFPALEGKDLTPELSEKSQF